MYMFWIYRCWAPLLIGDGLNQFMNVVQCILSFDCHHLTSWIWTPDKILAWSLATSLLENVVIPESVLEFETRTIVAARRCFGLGLTSRHMWWGSKSLLRATSGTTAQAILCFPFWKQSYNKTVAAWFRVTPRDCTCECRARGHTLDPFFVNVGPGSIHSRTPAWLRVTSRDAA